MNVSTVDAKKRRLQVLIAAALTLALLVFWTLLLTDQLTDADAVQNLHEAINLYRYGVISDSRSAPFEPTMHASRFPSCRTHSRSVFSKERWGLLRTPRITVVRD